MPFEQITIKPIGIIQIPFAYFNDFS